jgi:feruloyl esterase
MGGGGGYVGTIDNQAAGTLGAGFATIGTDTGHRGKPPTPATDASWALNDIEKLTNFGYRAVHLVAGVGKALVEAYYGRAADYAYFVGCSNGGRQAMMESQLYPYDFDGIVAGAPAYDFIGVSAAFLRNARAVYPSGDPTKPAITAPDIKRITDAILAACDALDGVKDGVLADPRDCTFDPAREPGLSPAAVDVVRAVREGPMGLGGRTLPGFPPGGEADAGSWDVWTVGNAGLQAARMGSVQRAFALDGWRYLILNDPSFDQASELGPSDVAAARAAARILNATDPDLTRFKEAGGKLIMYHGWADPALTALATVAYHDRVVETMGGAAKTDDFYRLFMMPGVLHCGGGSGPDNADFLGALVKWVENGVAPDLILTSKLDAAGKPVLTRPLCVYPARAVYGTGDPAKAESFSCK